MTPVLEDYVSVVEQLVGVGVPRDKAEAQAIALHPDAFHVLARAEVKRADVLEKAEQAAITKMAKAAGMTVYSLSQARASKQTPGLPDLWLAHPGRSFAGWFEVKRQCGGVPSEAQLRFRLEALAAGVTHGIGDRYEFARWLVDLGFPSLPIPR